MVPRRLVQRLQVALPLTLLLLLGSFRLLPGFADFGRPQVTALAVLALPVVLWSGWPYLRALGRPGRDGLLGLGVVASFAGSALAFWGAPPMWGFARDPYLFWYASLLVSAGLLGELLEWRVRGPVPDPVLALSARALRDGIESTVRPEDVLPGEPVEVRPGERVPVDGTILEGESAFDESLLTADPMPLERGPGDRVVAGVLNRSGTVVIQAAGSEGLVRSLLGARDRQVRPSLREPTDAAATRFLPLALAASAVALGLWTAWWRRDPDVAWAAVPSALSVLAAACPATLPLALPLLALAASRRAAEVGVEIRRPDVLATAARLVSLVGPSAPASELTAHPEGTPLADVPRPVALVSTGLPSAADLEAADVTLTLAPGGLARSVADVAVRRPEDVGTLLQIARATRAAGPRALAAALLPSALALPVASGFLDSRYLLDPVPPAVATAVSLVLLAALALALRRLRVG